MVCFATPHCVTPVAGEAMLVVLRPLFPIPPAIHCASLPQLVEPGGLLMTCSCSGAMSQSGQFVPMLQVRVRCVPLPANNRLRHRQQARQCHRMTLVLATDRTMQPYNVLLPQLLPSCCAAGGCPGCRATHHCAAGGRCCARPHAGPHLPRGPVPHQCAAARSVSIGFHMYGLWACMYCTRMYFRYFRCSVASAEAEHWSGQSCRAASPGKSAVAGWSSCRSSRMAEAARTCLAILAAVLSEHRGLQRRMSWRRRSRGMWLCVPPTCVAVYN